MHDIDLPRIENLTAGIKEIELLHGVSLTVGSGETHVLMDPNGAGKSTLGFVVMSSPKYTVTGGTNPVLSRKGRNWR